MEKQIINEENKYNTKDIAKWVRQTLKQTFPDIKFSIRSEYYSMGSSIHVTLIESKTMRFLKKFEEITDTEIFRLANARNDTEEEIKEYIKKQMENKHNQINQYHLDSDIMLSNQGKNVLREILKTCNKHNWDNSDIQTDYFDVNYYLHLSLGKWDKPFIDGVN